jgi:hypothetical protein
VFHNTKQSIDKQTKILPMSVRNAVCPRCCPEEDETMSIQEKEKWPENDTTINRRTFIGMSAGFCLSAGLGRNWSQIASGAPR